MDNNNSYEMQIKNILNQEDPTDRICITSFEQCCFIDELCINNLTKSNYFDFLCGNIPLPHIEIEIIGLRNLPPAKVEISVFTPLQGEDRKVIGVARMDFMSNWILGWLVEDDQYGIALASVSNIPHEYDALCGDLFSGFLSNFIGIQMCLLHPEYREILNAYKTVPVSDSGKRLSKKAAKRQRVARYVKYHIINDDKITQCKEKRKFERKCQAWFVLGHWRHYKNGTEKFIQGYWKGPLREYKRNLDNIRIREIVHEAN